jgi:hypothetical protein
MRQLNVSCACAMRGAASGVAAAAAAVAVRNPRRFMVNLVVLLQVCAAPGGGDARSGCVDGTQE